MFINSAFVSAHHLHADIAHQRLGTDMPLADSLAFPLRLWALSALQLLLRRRSARYCSVRAPGSVRASHKMMCNYGSVPPILSPIARVPGQAPAFHVAPQTSQASVLLLILKLSCADSPTLAQSHVGFCVPILFPAKRTPLLSRHQPWGSEEHLCWGPVSGVLKLFPVRPGFMYLLGKVGQKCWTSSKA